MSLVPLSDIFDVVYGTNLELNAMELDEQGINFVSRTARNNGVSAKVRQFEDVEPIEAGVLTVAGGGSVAEAFLQTEPFYSGRDLFYLKPMTDLTLEQKLFYCMCIRANKFRFNYGRQANKTLRSLLVPQLSDVPAWTRIVFNEVVATWSSRLNAMTIVK